LQKTEKGGMKALVKQNKPILSKCHRKEHIDFAISHEKYTLEDWKTFYFSSHMTIQPSYNPSGYIFYEK